jgi:hypothetical protein
MTTWASLSQQMAPLALNAAHSALSRRRLSDHDLANAPELALYHLQASLNASIEQNRAQQPAVALSILRQCVEALTVVEAGLLESSTAEQLLRDWREGLKIGLLRQRLQARSWPRYGNGLWQEPWSDFFAQLARAVQPNTHYSMELQQWQIAIVGRNPQGNIISRTDHKTEDAVKAARITLVQAIVIWALGRVVLANRPSEMSQEAQALLARLGRAIASSKLLFHSANWSDQLLPHVIFNEPAEWLDS